MAGSKMEVPFDVVLDDGTEWHVIAGPGEMIAMEERFGVSFVDLQANPRYTWLSFLAWHALRRDGRVEATWEDWRDGASVVGGASNGADAAGEG